MKNTNNNPNTFQYKRQNKFTEKKPLFKKYYKIK